MLYNPGLNSIRIRRLGCAFRQQTCVNQDMTMKEADRDRIRELCSLIAVEEKQPKLLQLIEELSRLLGAKDEERLEGKQIGI
jgi:hypothetical protein